MAGEVPRGDRVLVVLGGGIGAGKSTIGEVFGQQGFTVLRADDVGHDVLGVGSPTVDEVARRWPSTVNDGIVDRGQLAAIVFANPDELAALEAMTHPEIRKRLASEIDSATGPVVVEVPIRGVVDRPGAVRVAIVADPEIRLARAVARGGAADDIKRRMDRQASDDEWRQWGDITVDTSGAWSDTERRVLGVIGEIVDG